jgi:putative salt-induced outer membrane protein YdiY
MQGHRIFARFALVVLVLTGAAVMPVRAEVDAGPPSERIFLKGGRELQGVSRGVEDGYLRWEVGAGQELRIPLDWIDRMEVSTGREEDLPPSPTASPVLTPPANGAPKPDQPMDAEPPWTDKVPLVAPALNIYQGVQKTAVVWARQLTLGGTFTEGNARTDNITITSVLERNTADNSRQLDVGGQWSQNAGKQTANRWWINSNFDWRVSEAFGWDVDDRWIVFATSKNEYNALANLNYRGTVSTGVGYRYYFEPKKRLITRFGPAFTIESFKDPARTRTTPDMFAELELRWPLFDRTSFEQKLRVQPNIANFELVRVFSTTGLSVDLDEKDRWKLKLTVQTDYVSIPNPGRKPTDVTSIISVVYQRK